MKLLRMIKRIISEPSQGDLFTNNQPVYHFYIQDHLGNIRVVADQNGVAEQVNHYYPYGGIMADISTNQDIQRHKYNGKEYDRMYGLNLYDYGARHYDPATLAWTTMDPLAEKYYNISPYTFCHNNPIRYIDPDGKDDYYDRNGNFLGSNSKETDYIYIAQIKNSFMKDGLKYNVVSGIKSINDVDISAKSWSKIFTNVLSKMPDVDINNLHNKAISVTVWNEDSNIKISTDYYNDADYRGDDLANTNKNHKDAHITAFVWPRHTEERNILNTRSNIQNLLGAHEYLQHFINGYEHIDGVYDKAYENVRKHSTWEKTTPAYKKYINDVIKEKGYE